MERLLEESWGLQGLREHSVVLMGKNTLMKRCIRLYCERTSDEKWPPLLDELVGNVGIVFTKGDLAQVSLPYLLFIFCGSCAHVCGFVLILWWRFMGVDVIYGVGICGVVDSGLVGRCFWDLPGPACPVGSTRQSVMQITPRALQFRGSCWEISAFDVMDTTRAGDYCPAVLLSCMSFSQGGWSYLD